MHVHFMGEADDGICPTSQWGGALRDRGMAISFDETPTLSWRSAAWRRICRETDALHVITYSRRDHMLLRRIWWARLMGKPVVRSWIGSDVLWALHHAPSTRFALQLQELGVRQVAVADHLIDELSTIGIRAEYVPIITPQLVTSGPLPALPQRFTVLGYVPARRRLFYGGPVFDELIRRRPDFRFIVVGDHADCYPSFPNVEVFEHVENTQSLIEQSSVLIRPTLHDGMPRMMLEALALGRHVITPWRYPHCVQARHVDEHLSALDRLALQCNFNDAGSRFARREFDPHLTAAALRKVLTPSLNGWARDPAWKGPLQAIAFAVRHPGIWNRSRAPAPSAETLPDHATALRAALAG